MLIPLPSNRPRDRFYRGGARITAFRGEPTAGPREPEDWVASVTGVNGEPKVGQSTLPDGRSLSAALAADPVGWLGREHAARWGSDPQLLVKLLDAGQRLPVHAHPDDAFARDHLGTTHGKAEAWCILDGGTVHIGLNRAVTHDELMSLVAAQDVPGLLSLLHEVEVAPGDVVWVPPGELHAIGEGVFLLELQQPEDLSVLLEWDGFAIDGSALGHLGVGFPAALRAVTTSPRTASDLRDLVRRAPERGPVLPPGAERYFRLERVVLEGEAVLPAGYAVLVVTAGEVAASRPEVIMPAGTTAVRAASAGDTLLSGHGEVLVCRPPAP